MTDGSIFCPKPRGIFDKLLAPPQARKDIVNRRFISVEIRNVPAHIFMGSVSQHL